jgi:hypothetical protein
MNAVIARKGKYTLRYKGGDKVTTWDLEICADCVDSNGVYTLCTFIPDKEEYPDVKEIGWRLLDSIKSIEDLEDVKAIVLIAAKIIKDTDKIPLVIYQ